MAIQQRTDPAASMRVTKSVSGIQRSEPTHREHTTSARRLDRPIFIVGGGRCGSTILHEMLARHPRISYLSGLAAMYPDRPRFNRWAMHLLDLPLVGSLTRRKFRPAEQWEFWERHSRGFSEPCRDLRGDDVRPVEARRVARILAEMITPKRNRLLMKLTGWPRVGYLSEIFPDAVFIHVYRDGRAVVNSVLEVKFWEGWRGPEQWRWGELNPEQRAEWYRHDRSFVALAAIQWKIHMDAFETAKTVVPPSRFMEIRYEDFAIDPESCFGEIVRFSGLDNSAEFLTAIRRTRVESTNYKWKEQLTQPQQAILEECLEGHLRRYGYTD